MFSPLHGVTLAAEEVASACGCEPRAMEMLLNALVSLGLVNKNPDGYRDTDFAGCSIWSKIHRSTLGISSIIIII